MAHSVVLQDKSMVASVGADQRQMMINRRLLRGLASAIRISLATIEREYTREEAVRH